MVILHLMIYTIVGVMLDGELIPAHFSELTSGYQTQTVQFAVSLKCH